MPNNQHSQYSATFLLIAYNQEKYIREAIEGAFSQTFEPLEIILSDDSSCDNTYEIMLEMAASYKGPHKIITRQNKTNMGTLLHVKKAIELVSGDLLVLAAGDDISVPSRVEKIYNSWRESGSWGIFSDFSRIDGDSIMYSVHEKNNYILTSTYRLRSYIIGSHNKNCIMHGATTAYDRKLFDYLLNTRDSYVLSEDGALSVLLHILDQHILYLEEPLVMYRSHSESLTNSTKKRLTWAQLLKAEKNIAKHALSQANRCLFLIECNNKFNNLDVEKLDINLLNKDYRSQLVIAKWWEFSLVNRVSMLFKTTGVSKIWMAPRLLPKELFLFVKFLISLLHRR